MKLIVNADDFGHGKGVNLGIIEAYQNGIVRSTTMMAAMPGAEHAADLAKENPGLKIGAHLTLTAGKSVGKGYKTITDSEGNFLSLAVLENSLDKIDLAEVEAEYEAQIDKIRSLGIEPDHFDSHHHTHNLNGIVDIFLKLAKKYDKPVRIYKKELLCGEYSSIKTTDLFIDDFYDNLATVEYLKECLEKNQEKSSVEIMCHPAYLDYAIYNGSGYNLKRMDELHVLTNASIMEYINSTDINLASFSDI